MPKNGFRVGERVRNIAALIGKVIVGEYPAANFRGVRKRFERRRLLVEEIRRLRDNPLDPETLELEPLLRRTELLVIGRDLDKGAERSFYLGAFRSWRAVPLKNVDVFPPLGVEVDNDGERDRVYFIDPRETLAKTIRKRRPTERVLPLAHPSTGLAGNSLRAS